MNKTRTITPEGRQRMSAGGRKASRIDKARAGRAGHAVMVANLVAKLIRAQPLGSYPGETPNNP